MPNRLFTATAASVIMVAGLFATVAAALVVGPAVAASAHAELESSSPQDGATLAALPAAVTLTFGEEIDPATARARVTVVDGDGGQRSYDPRPAVSGETATVPIEPASEGGAYTVTYRVVSDDAHPVEGSVRFTVTTGPPPESPSGEATTEPAAAATGTAPATTAPATTVPIPGTGALADDVNPAWLYLAGGLAVLGAGGTAVALVARRRTP